MTRLSQLSEDAREDFLLDGVLNATWLAHSCGMGVKALEEAANAPIPESITPEQSQRRATLFTLTRGFMEKQRDEQLLRAAEHLRVWAAFKKGELDLEAELPV